MIPITGNQKERLEAPTTNFGLYSHRMVSWNQKNNSLEPDKKYMEELCKKSEELFKSVRTVLKNKNDMQKNLLEDFEKLGLKTFEFSATLTSPFISGLGSGHPTEKGMILDRNTGLPYIQASSVKGVLRLAYALNLAEKGNVQNGIVDDKLLNKYFGSVDTKGNDLVRGQIVFLDVFPELVPTLKVDIMNPHFKEYYSGNNKCPEENESPVPISFISVKEGTKFVFRGYFLPVKGNVIEDSDKEEIKNAFITAFERIGFGGKTSVGYGRFKLNDRTTQKTIDSVSQNKPKTNMPQVGDVLDAEIKRMKNNICSVAFIGSMIEGSFQYANKSPVAKMKIKEKIKVKIINQKQTGGFTVEYIP